MWLPKDERKMLAFYFRKIGKPDEPETLKDNDDMKVLGWKEEKSNSDYDKKYIDRVWNADDMLKKRGFIGVLKHELWEKTLLLTIEGYDLGRKYASKLDTIHLWCTEYKFWIILGLIISFVSVLIAILKD